MESLIKCRKFEVVRKEGKWLPKELAEDWPTMIAQAKKIIGSIDKNTIAKNKHNLIVMMTTVEASLDQLANAKTASEFDHALQKLRQDLGSLSNPSLEPKTFGK